MYSPDSKPVTRRTAYIESRTAEIEEEIHALKRKGLIEEIALNTTDERCTSLDKNVR